MIGRAWRAFWRPWRVAFVLGAVTGASTLWVTEHPDTPMRSVVGVVVALGVLPWLAMFLTDRAVEPVPPPWQCPGRDCDHLDHRPEGER